MAKDTVITASSDEMRCIVVTPETTLFDEVVDFVALPLFDGELGVAPKHSPMIGRLGYGELRIVKVETTKRLYVDGGFVQVVDNVVSVLTNRAIESQGINVAAAQEQLKTAVAERAPTDEQQAVRERKISQARGQLRTAEHAK
jgi:F-type H+-transporting ATPase subunit epsilon